MCISKGIKSNIKCCIYIFLFYISFFYFFLLYFEESVIINNIKNLEIRKEKRKEWEMK